jgi:hypothetical protein
VPSSEEVELFSLDRRDLSASESNTHVDSSRRSFVPIICMELVPMHHDILTMLLSGELSRSWSAGILF